MQISNNFTYKALEIMIFLWLFGLGGINICYSSLNENDIFQQVMQINKTISNPLKLNFEFYKTSKLEDGTPVNLFIEKGKSNFKDGDYVWTKMIPNYASSEYKYVFEYQMDCTDNDMKGLILWLQENIGENVRGGSIDRPSWYKQEMTLTEVYEYCIKNNQKITMGYYNETGKKEAIIIIDTGSIRTRTSAEIGLVYFIYSQ